MSIVTNASVLRLFWDVVEETGSHDLLTLTDAGLIGLLLEKISRRSRLNGEERCLLDSYIRSRTLLIRDIAESRQMREC